MLIAIARLDCIRFSTFFYCNEVDSLALQIYACCETMATESLVAINLVVAFEAIRKKWTRGRDDWPEQKASSTRTEDHQNNIRLILMLLRVMMLVVMLF